ncbi:hypothetical protein [Neobacillus sp. FSL H8-0543]|uniref:hypothetical protein n=1 Tax=Neobacillus sp. FSL H8-0543 TaxID=2954672 RepID=UPI0031588DD6
MERKTKSRGKRKFRIVLVMLALLLLTVMVSTAPSSEKFEKWILQKYDIKCDKYNHWCVIDNKEIQSRSGTYEERLFFNIYEKDYEYENGEILTFRAVGIVGNFYEMEDGRLWRFLAFGVL